MIRRPPRSTLFPTRRSSDLSTQCRCRFLCLLLPHGPAWIQERGRSEEHTSELQSHLNLVCRLLLEKKKNRRETSRQSSTRTSPPRCSLRSATSDTCRALTCL